MNADKILSVAKQAAAEQLELMYLVDIREVSNRTHAKLSEEEMQVALLVAKSLELHLSKDAGRALYSLKAVEEVVTDTINVIQDAAPKL